MKKFILGFTIFVGSLMTTITSCKKSDTVLPPPTPTATTLTTINSDATLSVFSALVSRAGDATVVNQSATMVIPTDSAFNAAGITTNAVAQLTPSACDSIVRYYTFASAFNFASNANTETAFSSSLGPAIYADSTTTATYFNGVPSIAMTAATSTNAPFYKLNQYIMPPVSSVAQIAATDTTLALFNEAMTRTNLMADFASGSFTLLMPSNSAFIAAGYPNVASIDSADIGMLTKILTYNLVPNEYFENDLATTTSLTTTEGANVQVTDTNGMLQFVGNSGTATAGLLSNGELAGNVLTYKVNSLLVPQ